MNNVIVGRSSCVISVTSVYTERDVRVHVSIHLEKTKISGSPIVITEELSATGKLRINEMIQRTLVDTRTDLVPRSVTLVSRGLCVIRSMRSKAIVDMVSADTKISKP